MAQKTMSDTTTEAPDHQPTPTSHRSVFHSQTTTIEDGDTFIIEADQTIEGTPYYKVTNRTTGDSAMVKRDGDTAVLTPSWPSSPTDTMLDALANEVEVTIPKGVSRDDL